ncbi:ABC transporter ATP-binding protein [Aestuariivirga sp.]|uniref:ABC transporter ATP-binding protein n=1 Tax=Aestuariivirga sp. TaxID=2650926 RepID=UPI00391BD05C
MTKPLVVFDRVEKRFADFVAVKPTSFEIGAGEFLAIMGPSGCGKTTTLRMLAGLEAPTAGEIRFEGRVMNDVKPHERDTPMVWQSLALFPFLNARENVEFGLKMRGVAAPVRRQRALEWLDRLGIGQFAERNVAKLSGGQRQRVALARSLVTEPKILLLDEPLSALDAHLVIRMQSVLTKLQKELGITFVYVTHSQSEAFAMADRVIIMAQGEIAQIGRAKDIYRSPENKFVAEFVGRNNIFEGKIVSVASEIAKVETPLGQFTVTRPGQGKVGDPLSFVVAADLVQISTDRPAADNVVECQIISEQFMGTTVTLFLEAPGGYELKVQIGQRELEQVDFKCSSRLFASWPTARAHVFGRENDRCVSGRARP